MGGISLNSYRKIRRLEKLVDSLLKERDEKNKVISSLNDKINQFEKENEYAKKCIELAEIKQNEYEKLINETKQVTEQYQRLVGILKYNIKHEKRVFNSARKDIKKDVKAN